ncbi:hypothetical protein [Bacillus thuringiensis]|uniref:hypothetical protein n=1 Tax=Bacillus thuringiensis TaxID=1428 RepID=UPI0020751B51|nr:hypothetical protein [Bacillus thuringiensis]MED3275554.1 hypothetical protein [Bacillus thuringiensis]
MFKRKNGVSKVVTYYKKRKQEHRTFPNVLKRSFKPGKKDIPTVVCDSTEFRLMNGMKVYFCAALDISTRRVLGYSLDTCQDAQLVNFVNGKKFNKVCPEKETVGIMQ